MGNHIIWKFEAPPGTRFVNEIGSGANLYFGPGMETEIFMHLQRQLQNHMNAHLAKELQAMRPPPTPQKSQNSRQVARNSNNVPGQPVTAAPVQTPAVLPPEAEVRAAPVTQTEVENKEDTNEQV